MFNSIQLLIHSFFILLFTTLPIPSAPIVLNSYKVNGIYGGFITVIIGTLGTNIIHYYSVRFCLNFLRRKRYISTFKKIINLSKKIRKISFFELTLLMFSAYLPSFIKCGACGFGRLNLKKMLLACLIAQFPTQILFVIVSSKMDYLEDNLFLMTNNKLISFLLSISIASLIIFIITFSFRIYPTFLKKLIKIFKSIY